MTAFVVLVVLALVAVLAMNSSRHKGSSNATPLPSPPPSAPSAALSVEPTSNSATGPKLVLQVGDDIDVAVDHLLTHLDQLPAGASGVWATTLATDLTDPADPNAQPAPAFADVVHVFGVQGGRAFRQDIGSAQSALTDLGPASQVLQTQEYPVLVQDGVPVKVGSPVVAPDLDMSGAELPLGWSPGRFENLGYDGLLIKPADSAGNVEIAAWSPGGIPHRVTSAGRLVGVSDAGQAMWLDPSCPAGPSCVLYVGDIGGIHPSAGVRAPSGTRFADSPAALGGGGYVAAAAVDAGGQPILLLISPWQGAVEVIVGSAGAVASSGMFWLDGTHLIFAARSTATGSKLRMMEFAVGDGAARAFGPALPDGARLLTAYGSTGGVSVLP